MRTNEGVCNCPPQVQLLIAGSGSLAPWLREQGAVVVPFSPEIFEQMQNSKCKIQNEGIGNNSPLDFHQKIRGGGDIVESGGVQNEGNQLGILNYEFGIVLGLYLSEIDAFGLAPLEAQAAGLSTVILDRGGASETLLSTVSGEPVGYLVDTIDELFATVQYYSEHKKFPKSLSNVNSFHTIEYFSPERLSSDLLSLMSKGQ